MPQNRRIYLLDPKSLNPETIAVTFAKTSRSPKSFDEIAAELSDERSASFHEKWVVGYGHSSVAEHAVLHIAVENISRLAVECLESNRLASYTEKSSRYQIWDADSFYIPEEFQSSSAKALYSETCKQLFDAYETAIRKVHEYLLQNKKQQEGESERAFQSRLRSTGADVCRYLLPASALANLGISINARSLEHALCKMLSHPLLEVQAIGEEIKKKALDNVPTLVKYANPKPYLQNLSKKHIPLPEKNGIETLRNAGWCTCVDFDKNGAEKVLASYLFHRGSTSFQAAYDTVCSMSDNEKIDVFEMLFDGFDLHDIPARDLEYTQIMFDVTIDQGAYFELKRHRMMTQTVQQFSPYLGYAVPKLLSDAGVFEIFEDLMHTSASAFNELAGVSLDAAAYVLPNAFNRRVLLSMNLRSAAHLIKLRCAPNAHFAIRRPTLKIAHILKEKYPLFESLFSPCTSETWHSVEQDFFTKTF